MERVGGSIENYVYGGLAPGVLAGLASCRGSSASSVGIHGALRQHDGPRARARHLWLVATVAKVQNNVFATILDAWLCGAPALRAVCVLSQATCNAALPASCAHHARAAVLWAQTVQIS